LSLSIQHEREHNAALAHIVLMQVQAGSIVASLRRVLAIGSASLRSQVLRQVLEGLGGNGIPDSLLTGGDSEGTPVRPGRLEGASAADLAEALSRAAAISDIKDRAVALSIVAIAQAQSGEFSDALSTTRSSADPEARYLHSEAQAGRGALAL
jgi:hypothetical protein